MGVTNRFQRCLTTTQTATQNKARSTSTQQAWWGSVIINQTGAGCGSATWVAQQQGEWECCIMGVGWVGWWCWVQSFLLKKVGKQTRAGKVGTGKVGITGSKNSLGGSTGVGWVATVVAPETVNTRTWLVNHGSPLLPLAGRG